MAEHDEEDITSAHSPLEERREDEVVANKLVAEEVEVTPESERGLKSQQDDENITLANLASTSSLNLPGSDNPQQDSNSPSFLLLASLRSQITDLSSQVTSLNSKLITSYTKIGDLEDEVHDKSEQARSLQAQTTQLVKAKHTWEAALEGGVFIESVRSPLPFCPLFVFD
jgi:hypothetical protein